MLLAPPRRDAIWPPTYAPSIELEAANDSSTLLASSKSEKRKLTIMEGLR